MGRKIKNMLVGAGRLLDFSGSYTAEAASAVHQRRVLLAKRTVQEALKKDWEAVGCDIQSALNRAASEYGQKQD